MLKINWDCSSFSIFDVGEGGNLDAECENTRMPFSISEDSFLPDLIPASFIRNPIAKDSRRGGRAEIVNFKNAVSGI